jgi:hypothetical protein
MRRRLRLIFPAELPRAAAAPPADSAVPRQRRRVRRRRRVVVVRSRGHGPSPSALRHTVAFTLLLGQLVEPEEGHAFGLHRRGLKRVLAPAVRRRCRLLDESTAQTAHAAILGVAMALAFEVSIYAGTLAVAVAMACLVSALVTRGQAMDTIRDRTVLETLWQ